MARMRILTAAEQEAFNKPPQFNHRVRKQFFDLPKGLLDVVATLRSPSGQIGFLVLCAYFKATKRFYQPHDFLERDVSYAAGQLNLGASRFQASDYTETTRLRHQLKFQRWRGHICVPVLSLAALSTS